MAGPVRIAVIDIGKTNAKVVLFDLAAGREIAAERRANTPLHGPPYRHFDVDGLWHFIRLSLDKLDRTHGIDAISITTHGACFAVLDAFGDLALPVMDYEDESPDLIDADYRAIRPAFTETGSPRLPMGLNAGAMLHWQMKSFPEAWARVRWILPWPQYWAFRLTGELATEATSLGVHTDLWNPHKADFSTMVDHLGWRGLMPAIRPASAVLGGSRAEATDGLSLRSGIPVHSGIHDSNASLLPHLLSRPAPFAVMSTGTWVVTLAVGAETRSLDESRDTLVNVNALGDPTPSARFMGGRAFETLVRQPEASISVADRKRVLADHVMLLPSFPEGSGPFPKAKGCWTAEPKTEGERNFAVSLHLALMGKVDLDLIGARGDVVVEGPFAANADFLAMLATLTGRTPIVAEGRVTGTSFGAACLALGDRTLPVASEPGRAVPPDPDLAAYAARWFERVKDLA